MKERIAIIDGIRTPLAKVGTALKDYRADELGAIVVREILQRNKINPDQVDEVIMGNCAQPADAANIARVIALKAGLPNKVPAYSVHRNCASGLESISSGALKLLAGEADIIVAGGTESMTNIPFLFHPKTKSWFEQLMRAKTFGQKLGLFLKLKLKMFKPVIGIMQGLTDPVCNLIMGQTAEVLAKEFKIDRKTQDEFALKSHQKAVKAQENGILEQEIIPIPQKKGDGMITEDVGPRKEQTMEALGKMKPYFDRKNGTVTVANACPLTDGAAAVILMTESKAKEMGLTPLGFLTDFAYAGLEPERMGLGPIYATSLLLDKSGLTMADIELMEINEAFSVQVLANQMAFGSDEFAKKYLGKDKALGELKDEILNVNGGAVALGHPLGATGTRITITLLKEMHRRGLKKGVASLCVGGGQGGAFLLETV